MTRLYVLYDSRCALCRRLRDWLIGEPAWIPLSLIAAASENAHRMFPALPHDAAAVELTVIAADGRYWRGNHAWIVVLFALKRYRAWARRLANPLLLPFARQAFAAVSEHRDSLGWWMNLRTRDETAHYLSKTAVPGCDV